MTLLLWPDALLSSGRRGTLGGLMVKLEALKVHDGF